MSWQSHANNPGQTQRERFTGPFTILGAFIAIVAVLALLYPEQGLLGVLGSGDDIATIRYREALLRIYPEDSELRLKVAASLIRSGSSVRAEQVLKHTMSGLTPDQLRSVTEFHYAALQDLFRHAEPHSDKWQKLRKNVAIAAKELAGPNPPVWRLNQLADDAKKNGDIESCREYHKRIAALESLSRSDEAKKRSIIKVPPSPTQYRTEANIYFDAMERATNIQQRRQFFMQGVSTLQSGNLLQEAVDAGERHLDGLNDDQETLMFLTKTSLAANQPERAQGYIKKALGMGVDISRSAPS